MVFQSKYNHDARNDLGYGRVTPRFHVSRQRGGSFPYTEPHEPYEEIEDTDVDEDSIDALHSKITTLGTTSMDPYAINKTNPFYYGAGNLKLSDCFERPDSVLLEMEVMASSMYPLPGAYKGKNVMFNAPIGGVSGHSQTITNANPLRTGTHYGWSHAPLLDDDGQDEDIYSLEDIIDLITREDQ
jgi:hypothetical protein